MPFSSISEYKIVGTNIIGGRGVFKNAGGTDSLVLGNDSAQNGAVDSIFIGFSCGENEENSSIIIGNRSANVNAAGNPTVNNVIVGNDAGTVNENNVVIGHGATQRSSGTISSTVIIGDSACSGTGYSGGIDTSVAIGRIAASSSAYCADSIVIGYSAANMSQGVGASVIIGPHANESGLSQDSILIGHNAALSSTCYSAVFIGTQLNTSTNNIYDCVFIGGNITLINNKTYTNSIVVAPNLTDANGTVIPDNSVIIGNSGASYLNFGQGKLVYQSANGLSVQGGLSVSGGASNFTRVNLSSALYAFDLVITTYFYIVATLPAPSAALKGARAFVSDLSNALIFGATPIGGGTQTAPVWCDGANWYVG